MSFSKSTSPKQFKYGSLVDPNTRSNRRLMEEIENIPSKCSHSTAPIGAVSHKSGREKRWGFKARPSHIHKPEG